MEFIVLHAQNDRLYQLRMNNKILKKMIKQMRKAEGIHIYSYTDSIIVYLDKSKWEVHSLGEDNVHIYPREVKR